MTIIEFLTARYDEEEAVAKAAPLTRETEAPVFSDVWHDEAIAHVLYHRPSHILADIAAKRRIVEWCGEREQIYIGTLGDDGADAPDPKNFIPGPLRHRADAVVLRMLASVFADHEQYNEEWRP